MSRIGNRDDPLHQRLAVACSIPPLTEGIGYDATVRAIEVQDAQPRLLVVDTWARAAAVSGVDENSSGETGKLVAALDRLRARFPGMAQLVVHHPGNNGKDRPRGSYALPSACDVIVHVEAIKAPGPLPKVKLVFDKVKDGERPQPLQVDFGQAIVRTDEKGRDVTSLFVGAFSPCEDEPDKPVKQTTKDALRDALRGAGDLGLDFARAKEITGKSDSSVSEAFKVLVLEGIAEPFSGTLGEKRWRRKS